MAIFKVSVKANQDLLEIGAYTQNKWGVAQRNKYLDALNDCFKALADNPGLAHSCDDIRSGYRAYFIGKHVIFYRNYQYGIRIVRILHQKMHYKKHL